MGQISVEKSASPGSDFSGNQQLDDIHSGITVDIGRCGQFRVPLCANDRETNSTWKFTIEGVRIRSCRCPP